MATKSGDAAKDDLQAQVDALRNDLAAIAATLGEMAGQRGQEGFAAAKSAADEAKRRIEEVAGSVEERIVERPLGSMLIALGVGLVIGKLLDRR